MLRDTVLVMAHTETAREIRIISMRKATMHRDVNMRDRKLSTQLGQHAPFARGIRSPLPQTGLRLTSRDDYEQSLYFQNL
jgi:hypothetical protein